MLWLGMGLGKTITVLTAFTYLQDRLITGPLLVIGPLRVIQSVWRKEALKWSHTRHLRFSLIHGKPVDRERALRMPADVYLVNYEGVHTLVAMVEDYYLRKGRYPPFSMIIEDEVTRLKNSQSRTHKHLQRLLPYTERRVGLTGTPAPNGYADLFGQYLAVDQGERLGQSIGSYRAAFLTKEGWAEYGKYVIRKGMDRAIHECIADITLEMASRDYLELPEVLVNDIMIDLPPKLRAQYEQLEKEMFVELDSNEVLEVFSVVACTMKCRQFVNGAAYLRPEDPHWEHIHDEKLDALSDIIEEAGGAPVLVSICFKHDAERIMKRWPQARAINSKLPEREFNELVDNWNCDHIPILCGHPLSLGHGLNLQHSSCTDIVHFGQEWAPDLMDQVVARVMRQGQRNNIRVHRLMVDRSVDILISDALAMKSLTESTLKASVSSYRTMKGY